MTIAAEVWIDAIDTFPLFFCIEEAMFLICWLAHSKWRKRWDSNPRGRLRDPPAFETGAINRSATLPYSNKPV